MREQRRSRLPARRRWVAVAVTLPLIAMGVVAVVAAYVDAGVRPLTKADGWRTGLPESFDHDPPFGLVEIAYDRDTAEQAWAENVPEGLPERRGRPDADGRYGSLDDVDFSRYAVVVWSSGQSSSCPSWLSNLRTGRDGVVSVTTRQPGLACTDDYNAYRMVLVVRLSRLPAPAALPTTEVVVNGRSSGWGSLVRAYPT